MTMGVLIPSWFRKWFTYEFHILFYRFYFFKSLHLEINVLHFGRCKSLLCCINICFIFIQIKSQKPNHPANSFYYPRLTELPPLATIWVKRQGRTSVRQQNQVSNHILPDTTKLNRFSGRSAYTFYTFNRRAFCLLIVILNFHCCTFHLAGKSKKEVLCASCRCFGLPQHCARFHVLQCFFWGSKQLKLDEP